MVRIVNGEIIRDEPSQRQTGSRQRPVISDLRSTAEASKNNQQRENSRPRNEASAARPVTSQAPHQDANQTLGGIPLFDNIAQQFGIADKVFTVPAIPQAGLSETRVGYIYGIIVALLVFIFGWKVLLIVAVLYFVYKSNTVPAS